MGKQVLCGVATPQAMYDRPIGMAILDPYIRRSEELGFHSLWVGETPIGQPATLEPVNLMAYAAAITSTIRLGAAVIIATLRNPVQLAKGLSSLDNLAGGRLIVGMGLGRLLKEYPAFGVDPQTRVRRFLEILEVMKALWTEREVHYEGQFWQLDGTTMEPKPIQKPYPPIWLAGIHPAALKRAVRHGDGWTASGFNSLQNFRECVDQLNKFLVEADRDPSTFLISKRIYVAVDKDEARAKKRLAEWRGSERMDSAPGEMCAWGSPTMCVERLKEVVDAGAHLLILGPIYDEIEQIDMLAEEVVPHL